MIGRAAEISQLRRLLGEEQQRIVTIVGPGGIGKTRLALDLTAGRYAEAIHLSEQSMALHRELGNRLGLSEALQRRSQIADAQAAYEEATR